MHCIAQVALKTVVADFSTFEIIKMQGNTEERAPMKAGPFGKIVADFPDGSETVDYANLMLEPKPVQKKKKKQKTNKTKKHVLKRPAVCKKQQQQQLRLLLRLRTKRKERRKKVTRMRKKRWMMEGLKESLKHQQHLLCQAHQFLWQQRQRIALIACSVIKSVINIILIKITN
jgi:hypothetical protein